MELPKIEIGSLYTIELSDRCKGIYLYGKTDILHTSEVLYNGDILMPLTIYCAAPWDKAFLIKILHKNKIGWILNYVDEEMYLLTKM